MMVSIITRFGTERVIKVVILLLLRYPRKCFTFVGVRGRFMEWFAGSLSRTRVYVVLIHMGQHNVRHVRLRIQPLVPKFEQHLVQAGISSNSPLIIL